MNVPGAGAHPQGSVAIADRTGQLVPAGIVDSKRQFGLDRAAGGADVERQAGAVMNPRHHLAARGSDLDAGEGRAETDLDVAARGAEIHRARGAADLDATT